MNQTIKRRLSLLLCAVMLLSLFTIGAAAATTEAVETNVQKILTDAYALESGESLDYTATLTGKIKSIKDPYNSNFGNISVWMEMTGYADKPILAYRVKGEGAENLLVDDTITVTGTITNYNGTIEFAQGCTLDKVVKNGDTTTKPAVPGLIAEGTATFANWEEAFLGFGTCFVPSEDGTVTVEILSCDPGFYLDVWADNDWLEDFVGAEADTVKIAVSKGVTYDFILSSMLVYGFLSDYAAGSVSYRITSDVDPKVFDPTDPEQVMGAAYALEPGETLEGTYTLVGTISTIDTPWSDQYGNITVSITVEGKALKCFRLAGEGAKDLQVGDTITVTGSITNYNGSVQFTQGCTLDNVVKGSNVTPVAPSDPKEIVDEAYALKGGAVLPYEATLTGKLTEIVTGYNSTYKNITVKLVIEGRENKPILCYRMKGDGCETLKVGDTITVTGNIKNYVKTDSETGETTSTIEFSPCTLAAVTPDTGNGSDYTGPNFPGLYSLAVVGSGLPGISEWTPGDPAGDMKQVSYGVYVKYLTCSAGTSMKLKIQGNDVWDDSWNFGSATLILGQKADLENSGGSRDMSLSVEKDCTIKITVDLNPMTNGGAATILVEEVADGGNTGTTKKVTLSIKVPESWTKVYAFSWDSTGAPIMGGWPGAQVPKSGDWYKGLINGDVNNLIINNGFMQSEDLYIQNGKDVWVVVSENIDSNYKYKATVTYTEPVSKPEPEHYPGDINGDDKLNIVDVSKLYAHVRGTNTLTDPDVLARADVSGDGKLNIADVSKLYAYVRGVSPEAVVDAAYRLQENDQMTKPVTLTGTVTEILEPYNSKYKAVTLVIQIDGRADKPIICSRLRGDDAAYVIAGDTVTVTGILQNYYGSVEFAEGCTLDKWVDVPSLEEQQWAAVDAAYQLPENSSMDRKETLTGKVISIDQAYASNLPYISITIAVPGREDKPIGCYRLVGADIALVKIGDTVTVAGTLRNYYGTVEFAANCSLVDYTPDGTTVETNPLRIVDAAYALAPGTALPYKATLTGKIVSIDTEYSYQYNNITVTIAVAGKEDKPIKCYRLKGDGVATLAVGNTITVSGTIKNYQYSSGDCDIEFDLGCTLQSVTK